SVWESDEGKPTSRMRRYDNNDFDRSEAASVDQNRSAQLPDWLLRRHRRLRPPLDGAGTSRGRTVPDPCLQTEQRFRAWLRTIVPRILTGAAGRGGPDLTGRGRSLERARRAQPWPGRRTAGLVVRRARDTEGCPGLAASRPGRRLLSPRVRG